jgi:phage shock protein A
MPTTATISKPSGKTVKRETLRAFNLTGGFKPKYLDIKATKVDVILEIDKTLDDLIKAGKEGLKIEHLGNVAKAAVEKTSDAFAETVKNIEKKIESDRALLDPVERDKKIKEANEVLKHYAKIVETNVNKAVQDEWNKILARKAHLKNFRIKCITKIALGTIGVAVATASIALSFGTMWMSAVGIVKGIASLAQTIKTMNESMQTTYAQLVDDIQGVSKLNDQREKAKKSGESQAGSKATEAAKEFANAILPITKSMVSSASAIESRATQLLGQSAKVEDQADDLVGKINQLTKQMSSLPTKLMNDAQAKAAKTLDEGVQKLVAEVANLHKDALKASNFGDRALKAVQKLKREDSWTAGTVADSTNWSSRTMAVYSLANFCYECAKNGAKLIPT